MTLVKTPTPTLRRQPMSASRQLLVALFAVVPLVGYTDEVAITITFDGENCPASVSLEEVTLTKSRDDRILWSAVKGGQPYTGGYEIYFDPFKSGPPLKSGSGDDKDQIRSQKLHDHVPLASYKYTIVGYECTSKPLDPRIRVL